VIYNILIEHVISSALGLELYNPKKIGAAAGNKVGAALGTGCLWGAFFKFDFAAAAQA
jgi:hypothetical protein